MPATKVIAISLMTIFNTTYMFKKLDQRRKGIVTNQIEQGQKLMKVMSLEKITGIATIQIIPMELVSIIYLLWVNMPPFFSNTYTLQRIGICITTIGISFFIIATLTLSDNWRASIPDHALSTFVSHGIYRINCNPAIVGFDLMYLGLLIAFPNIIHLILGLLPIIMLQMQTKQEEAYCQKNFGAMCTDYCTKIRRCS